MYIEGGVRLYIYWEKGGAQTKDSVTREVAGLDWKRNWRGSIQAKVRREGPNTDPFYGREANKGGWGKELEEKGRGEDISRAGKHCDKNFWRLDISGRTNGSGIDRKREWRSKEVENLGWGTSERGVSDLFTGERGKKR